MRWGESYLLDFRKIILGIFIQGELAKSTKRHIVLRPDLRQIEDIPAELLCLFRTQDLDIACPRRVIALFDGVKQILCMVVRVLGSHLTSFRVGKGLTALVCFAMDLDIVKFTIRSGKLIGVTRIAVHMTIRVRGATVREEVHHLMCRLLMRREVIPEHSSILEVGLWISFLSMNKLARSVLDVKHSRIQSCSRSETCLGLGGRR